jgi:hypothetical protein
MKSLLNLLFSLCILALSIAGCEEDPNLTVLRDVSFSGPITASEESVILVEADSIAEVITFNWPAVDYFVVAPVTYSIQVTTPSDEATWANAREVTVGNDVLTYTFAGKQLNEIGTELGLEPGTEYQLVCRVKSFVDRSSYSESIRIALTTYEEFTSYPSLWVPGAYEGWDPSTAPTIVSVNNDDIFEGYLYFPTGEIKLTAQPAWEPMAYGDGGSGNIIEANYAGGNFNIAEEGYYLFAADLNTMKYLLVKTTWGIIGGATPGGWGGDTQMTYDPDTKAWSVTCDMLAAGSFKFRANGAWQYDFGKDDEGNLAYCNHPWKPYVDRPQFTVPSDGNYTITLDLSVPGDYQYSIVKN